MYRGISCTNPLARFEKPEADGDDVEGHCPSFELEEDSDDEEPLVDEALVSAIDAMEEEILHVGCVHLVHLFQVYNVCM